MEVLIDNPLTTLPYVPYLLNFFCEQQMALASPYLSYLHVKRPYRSKSLSKVYYGRYIDPAYLRS